ncbi:hypothetical protein NC980_20360 [Leptolyngbya sp. AS-A5]
MYEVDGERLVIADPMNRSKRCESLPREMVEAAWDGQLWLVEPLPKAATFNLDWFLPAIWPQTTVDRSAGSLISLAAFGTRDAHYHAGRD